MSSTTKKCVGKDVFERMNFLYQASNLLVSDYPTHHKTSSMYSNLLVNICRKAVLRLDIPIKRSLCKTCRIPLLPGITCKVRIKKKKIIWTCLTCNTCKMFDSKIHDFVPWTLQDESIVEVLDYSPIQKDVM